MFDVFINNWDRFPFIWRKEEGNHANFMFLLGNQERPIVGMPLSCFSWHLQGIDQTVTGISSVGASSYLYQDYCSKVRALMSELASVQPKDPQWSKVLVFSCKVDWGSEVSSCRQLYSLFRFQYDWHNFYIKGMPSNSSSHWGRNLTLL